MKTILILLILLNYFSLFSSTYEYILVSENEKSLSELHTELDKLNAKISIKFENIVIIHSDNNIKVELELLSDYNVFTKGDKTNHNKIKNNELLNTLLFSEIKETNYDFDYPCYEENIESITKNKENKTHGNDGTIEYLMCYGNPWELCDTTQWEFVLKNIDIFKIYIGDINDRADEELVKCFVKKLLDNDIKIAIELGGLLDWHANKTDSSAEFSFQQDLEQLQPLIDIIKEINPEKNIDILEFDGPIRRMLFPNNKKSNFHTIETAVEQLFIMLEKWKNQIPNIELNLLTNFPNWAWGDTPAYFNIDGEQNGYGYYIDVLNEIEKKSDETGLSFDALTIDNPYDYAIGRAPTNQNELIKGINWSVRLRELENYARELGYRVNIIFNTGSGRNDSTYFAQTVKFVEYYRELGGKPNGIWVQSWYDVPGSWLPETENYTMTNLVKTILKFDYDSDFSNDFNKTSEKMIGISAVALFFVNNTAYQQTNAPTWNTQNQSQVITNVILNLNWWVKTAANFGVQKTFEIVPYYFDNPAVQIDFDPTIGYTSISSGDHKFQNPIMENLGYSEGNQINKMRAFLNDLRDERETNWAFCAFILTGNENVRAHASLQGPSTVLMASSAGNGYVFAHEVGHIYGAFDEYWEAGTASYRSVQQRYGIINGNFDFRNYPIIPSIMATNFSGGLSYYAANHIGIADKMRFINIKTIPENMPYSITYFLDNDNPLTPQKHKGELKFPWSEGMKIRLQAPSTSSYNKKIYNNPTWDISSSSTIEFIVDSLIENNEIVLKYNETNEYASYEWNYYNPKEHLPGSNVQTITINDVGTIGFGGIKGISIFDGESRHILDIPFTENDRDPAVIREAYSSDYDNENAIYFSSQGGEIIRWHNGEHSKYKAINNNLHFKEVAVHNKDLVWAIEKGSSRDGGRDENGSGLHKFENRSYQIFNEQNSLLPSNNINSISQDSGNSILLALPSKSDSDGESTIYSFNHNLNKLEKIENLDHIKKTRVIKKAGKDSQLILSENQVFLITNSGIKNIEIESQSNLILFDVAYRKGLLAIATNQGLWLYKDEKLMNFNTNNSELTTNFCYSVDISPNYSVFVATNTLVNELIINDEINSYIIQEDSFSQIMITKLFPNPLNSQQKINLEFYLNDLSQVNIQLLDINGNILSTLNNSYFNPGLNQLSLNLSTQNLSNGMYIIKIDSKFGSSVKKIMVSK